MRRPLDQPFGVSWASLFLFIVIALLPVLFMVGHSFFDNGHFTLHAYGVLSEIRVWGLLLKSLAMSTGACLLSLILGLPFSLFLAGSNLTAHWPCQILYLVPLFIPPHVHAIGWIYLFGDNGAISSSTAPLLYSHIGASIILFLAYSPVLILLVLSGLSRLDSQLIDAALLHRKTGAVLRRITLPLIRPYIVSGTVFVFIFSFFNYGVPSMLRVSSFPVEILAQFSAFYDEASAVALSTPLIAIALLLLWVQGTLANRGSVAVLPLKEQRKGQTGKMGTLFVYLFIIGTVIFPLTALILQAGGLKTYQLAWNTSYQELGISLGMAATAATLVTILAYFLCQSFHGKRTKSSRVINMLTFLPFAFPAPLFGIGLIRLWNTEYTQFIYATSLILLFAYISRFLPFAVRIIDAALTQVQPSSREAALLYESRWLMRLIRIELPQARQGLLACWIVIFIFCMGELGATLLVIPPGQGTVALKIYTLMHYGAGALVAALALILIAVNLIVAAGLLFRFNARSR